MTTTRHPTRWIKVTWLSGLASGRTSLTTQAAHAALEAIDEEDTARLVAALRSLELHAATWPVRDLATGARACVERADEEATALVSGP
jgi:hypothetical protein